MDRRSSAGRLVQKPIQIGSSGGDRVVWDDVRKVRVALDLARERVRPLVERELEGEKLTPEVMEMRFR